MPFSGTRSDGIGKDMESPEYQGQQESQTLNKELNGNYEGIIQQLKECHSVGIRIVL
jgi:hypothetical protein